MKKLISVCLLLILALSCAGCGIAPAPAAATPAPTEAPAEPSEPVPVESSEPVPAEPAEPETTPQPEDAPEAEAQSSVLVVYFSGTGNTRRIAERIAAITGADLEEILPVRPYTEEDLNYNDPATRATVEQNTPDARPEIANEISLDGYTTVYLGYPIWWGQAPRILSTFVESHDFTGITVIPFCTSGSSGAGSTGETLGEQAGTGDFRSSTRMSADISDSELQSWLGQ